MLEPFIFLLVMLYYWYFYFSTTPEKIPPPGLKPTKPIPLPKLHTYGGSRTFHFRRHTKVLWDHVLPSPYIVSGDKIIRQSACIGVADGQSVKAEDEALYEYLKTNSALQNDALFPQGTADIIQKGNVFYFQCRGNAVSGVHTCPSGTVYRNKACVPLTRCSDKPDGVLFHHPDSYEKYIECQNENEIERTCPQDEFFLHNRCYDKYDLLHYCMRNTAPFLINKSTKVTCVNQKPVIQTCPPNEQYFDDGNCKPAGCVGKPNGTIIKTNHVTEEPFEYATGYDVCENDQVRTVTCASSWNPRLAVDLTHLPMVYHNDQCEVPVFCENVFPTESGVVVPKADFYKSFHQWPTAPLYDSLSGYTCENKRKAEVAMPPGSLIKKFKKDLACENQTDTFPIFDSPKQYFDCQTNGIRDCPPGTHYKQTCVADHPNAFQFKGIDVFAFENLTSYDNWLAAWNYANKLHDIKDCPDTEPVLIPTYNVCSHPDCDKYPFLSQVDNMYIFLPEKGYMCMFSDKSIKKLPSHCEYSFWNQRCNAPEEPCEEGEKINSGNFIWDQSIYATCDEDQPFVFCPSSKTEGIELVELKKYACKFPKRDFEVNFKLTKQPVAFKKNELWDMMGDGEVTVNKSKVQLSPTKAPFMFANERIELSGDLGEIRLRFQYKQTYPPDIYYDYQKGPVLNRKNVKFSAFITRQMDFTEKPVEIPKHNPIMLLPGYKQDG